ncbi:MAG TPA: hypothetical protein PKW08_02055 [Flavobacteriaceae bacterium]|nr:hypothetical protein [Flavobacteriaceae bacterium]MCB9213004.1 hypothetical protein [Alteromonas sp.]HPF10909.1 hypothetical protein [Flavobacteriaceae bacterium]HQU20349.1 hypothetical protein [Flavobacteriaceae bacterium]HQU64241.1 hypothetical protein [Flavobacteriaceae bacterium]
MELLLEKPIDLQKLKEALTEKFPDYKVKQALFNKKVLRITNGFSQVVVAQRKNGTLLCVGNLNTMDWRIFIPFVLLLAAMLISGIIFILIMSSVKKKQFKAMEEEVLRFLEVYTTS